MKQFESLGRMLSKAEQKKIRGGLAEEFPCKSGPCTLTIQGSDGSYVTRNGNCAMNGNHLGCYCDVGLGSEIPVTSNGGVSRCWSGTE